MIKRFFIVLLLSHMPALSWGAQVSTSPCDQAKIIFGDGYFQEYTVGMEDQAAETYKKAVELCPGYIRPYERLGNIYRKGGRHTEAIEYFTKAAQLGTTNYKLYYLLAHLHFQNKNYSLSVFHLNKSLEIRPDYPNALSLKKKLSQVADVNGPIIDLYEPIQNNINRVAHFYDSFSFRGQLKDQNKIASLTIGQTNVPVDSLGKFLIDIPIQSGLNTIPIIAKDNAGNTTKLTVELHRMKKISDTQIYRKSFAVVIGINNYEKIGKLESAVSDALAVQSIFQKNHFDNITLILNKEATQRRILTELYSELPSKVSLDDRVIFYFAGHGITLKASGKPDKGFIIPVESSDSDYPDTAISMSQIRDLCSHIRAKHIMFIMDCCYAGQIITEGQKMGQHEILDQQLLSHRRVIQIITAGGKDQQALEVDDHGVFTKFFLQSIEGQADVNKDNVVSGREIGNFVIPKVTNITAANQTPIFSHIEGKGEVLFFLRLSQ